LSREAGKRLLGVVLLSDGAQRAYAPRDLPPQTAAARLKHLGCPDVYLPVWPIARAGRGPRRRRQGFSRRPHGVRENELTIRGQVRVDGYVNRRYSRPRAL